MFEKNLMDYANAMEEVTGRQYFKAQYSKKKMHTVIYVTDNMENAQENLKQELRSDIIRNYGMRSAADYSFSINEISKEEIDENMIIVHVTE